MKLAILADIEHSPVEPEHIHNPDYRPHFGTADPHRAHRIQG
jgi:hypothetical protein